jgi:tetratricopeptide (TPR) repeat protein
MGIAYLSVPGQVENTLELARKTHAIADRLAAAHPDRDDYGLLLANSEILLGDALEARGLLDMALERFRAGAALMKRLTDRNTADGDNRRRLVYVQQRIGDTLRKQGNSSVALRQFEDTLVTAKALVQGARPKADWLRALALAHQRMGDMYREQSDLDRALVEFTAYREVTEQLVKLEPANVPNWTWRLDLWIGHQRIGDVLLEKGEHARALEHYRIFHKGAEEAALRDPEQGEWQRFLANSRLKIGDALLAQEKFEDALAEYAEVATIYRALAAKDGRPRSQRNLAIAHYQMGMTRLAMNDPPGALAEFQTCLSMEINEGARDAQITMPLFVRQECSDRAAQINKRAAR